MRAVLGEKLPDVLTGRKGDNPKLAGAEDPESDRLAGLAAELSALTAEDRARLEKLLKGAKGAARVRTTD